MKRTLATLLLTCALTAAAFWAVADGIADAQHRLAWYQACDRATPAQERAHVVQGCLALALR